MGSPRLTRRVRRLGDDARVELTPMIDVVFLLLIFFLVATTFQQSEREMEITLPETVSGGPISMALRELVINVDAQGRYIVSGRTLDEDALRGAIQSALAPAAHSRACCIAVTPTAGFVPGVPETMRMAYMVRPSMVDPIEIFVAIDGFIATSVSRYASIAG